MMLAFILSASALSAPAFKDLGMPCADSKIQAKRSAELQKIRQADQDDRAWQIQGKQPTQKILEKMGRRDLVRRKRVGEIFGEGCLKTAADYEAAYIVYQHGNTELGGCWCIQPIEESFTPSLREEYRGGPNAAYTGTEYLKILNAGKSCSTPFCATELKASPQGTLPGFW